MTDLLLKNKKLLNEDIIEFSYNNEVFNNEVNDIITSFKNNYITTEISFDDKEILYSFIKNNENNKALYKNMINDFIILIQYLNDLKKKEKEDSDDNISENSKIYEVLEQLKNNLSKEFLSIFEEKKELTVNKTTDFFEYYLKLIYKYVRDEIKDYQEELEEKELKDKKNKLEEYYQKNIVNYLKAKDLWDKNIYNDQTFTENLNEFKNINIQINQILFLVDIKEEDISDFQEASDNSEVENESENEEDERE